MNKKHLLIDADSLIYKSACIIQSNPIIVTHELSKRKKQFENKTAFNEWLAGEGKVKGYCKDMFIVEDNPQQTEDISHALHILKNKVESIVSKPFANEYTLFIGGDYNYRKDVATILPYKGNRPAKPLAFDDVRNYLLNKYKKNIVVAEGQEAEDAISIIAHSEYQKARKTRNREDMGVIVCGIDKDLRANIPGWHWNYDTEGDVFWLTDLEVAKNFYTQCLIGDRGTDNIPGVTVVSDTIKTKYNLRSSKGGIGEKSAESILNGCKTEKEMASRVLECYKEGFKDDWEKHIVENALLLRLRRTEGEMFNILEHFNRLQVMF